MAGDSVISPQRSKDFGKLDHGCDHYKRRCKILAPCCNKTFPCRHCHNETSNSLSNPKDHHDLVRQDVKQVICSICNTQQEVAQVCSHCGVNMGEYFCDICKFYDDDITKGQFHCNDRGICRVGGRDKFFHCEKCGSCYMVDLRDNHFCVENSMKSYCPICFEYLFDSVKSTRIMKCGHTMHMECFSQMAKQNQCPICCKAVLDMSAFWEDLDMDIDATRMPAEYQFEVSILCNDCNSTSTVQFHVLGLKCRKCNSYNTRRVTEPANHCHTY
ncbi:hypothetical protein ERO13_A08G072900v2 [Gossypium hirsutum]|uniref:E3 ubiquitin-protein ligase MIEL1 isoform X2 n=2 Tax=Gossypium TaxID=3633 RepID=A0A1U8IF07_GOSHI|nr:E3 ubiquitin-protein ligase MIEL1-like isoform X2 [Gossypium hirsutum]XP_040930434.1 E3 ubiquitin-protein ligase MIEL1-like isoform X2 [Gossypium hirsutum]KAG4186916.1 hypothetical protein ERO13_A08G072900v2 [Gossypium hirsutum]TYI13846.1 hypothetical protein ES332_A08G086500v1 [Gossypium tomentosum]